MENQEISVKSQKFKELYPSAQFSSENENFVNISKRLLKNRKFLNFSCNALFHMKTRILSQIFYP